MILQRKYGEATTITFELYETDGTDLKTDAVHAAGDTKIMKDEGDEANTTNGFVDEGQGYSLALTATEMEAARITIYVVDQGTKAWHDRAIHIETYGHASAQHAFDKDSTTVNLSAATEGQIDAIETDTNEIQGKLPTNKIMGSSVVTDKDDEIDAIKAKTDLIGASVALESGGNLATVLADTNELQGLISDGKLPAQVKGIDDIDLSATMKTSVNAEVDTALNTAIPGSPTADSINERVKAIDNLTQGSGSGDLAAVKAKTDVIGASVAPASEYDTEMAHIDQDLSTTESNITTAITNAHTTTDGKVDAVQSDVTAIKAITDTLTLAAIADAVWDEANSGHVSAGTVGLALSNLLKIGKNKWAYTGTTFTIYDDNGSTPLYSFTLDSAEAPTSRTPA